MYGILKGFSQLVICFNVQDCFFLIIPFQCSIRKKGFFAKDMAKTDE